MKNKLKKEKGYVLLLAVLLITAASLVIVLSLSRIMIDQLSLKLGQAESLRSFFLAEACLDDGLEKLRANWQDYSYSLSIDGNSCTIDINSAPTQATIEAIGSVGNYTKKIDLLVDNFLEIISRD